MLDNKRTDDRSGARVEKKFTIENETELFIGEKMRAD